MQMQEVTKIFSKGFSLHQLGKLSEAKGLYLRVLKYQPNHFDALHLIGVVEFQENKVIEAIKWIEKALEVNSKNAAALSNLGNAQLKLGLIREAIASYDQAISLLPAFADAWCNRGNAFLELKKLDEAITSCDNAIKINPNYAEAYFNRGNALLNLKKFNEAIESYDHTIKIRPTFINAYINRGNALNLINREQDALKSYEHALTLDPNNAVVHCNTGNIYSKQRNYSLAKACYLQALKNNPNLADAYANLGTMLSEEGQAEKGLEMLEKAISIAPDQAAFHLGKGKILKELLQYDDALKSFQLAITTKPDYAEAYESIGNLLAELGKRKEAVNNFKIAININPLLYTSYVNCGNAFYYLSQYDEALSYYDKAIRIKSDCIDAYSNRAGVLNKLGRYDEAIKSCKKALEINPNFASAYLNLGNIFKESEDSVSAIEYYDKAILVRPDYAEAYSNRGSALREIKKFDEALASCNEAVRIKKDYAEGYCSRGNSLKELQRFDEALDSYSEAISLDPTYDYAYNNYIFVSSFVDHRKSFSVAKSYGEICAKKAKYRYQHKKTDLENNVLRVGFISGDFRKHPVSFFLESFLEPLKSKQIQLFAYSNNKKNDLITESLKSNFYKWNEVSYLNDETLAQKIYEDRINILFDLSGHTAFNRLPVFSYKPAPIQVSWLGFFATTGIPEIDYFLGDSHLFKKQDKAFFIEKIWTLPETAFCFTPPNKHFVIKPSHVLPCAVNGHITFGSLNNLFKVNDEVVSLWSKVLMAVPDSRLFLSSSELLDDSVKQKTYQRFEFYGINRDRLILSDWRRSREDHLALYNNIDIALDPFPYNGGTTSAEALWMGVPLLTLKGDQYLARLGEVFNSNIGLEEWVAKDKIDYVHKAQYFASEIEYLKKLRANLHAQVQNSLIFNGPRFANHFEEALREMWKIKQEELDL